VYKHVGSYLTQVIIFVIIIIIIIIMIIVRYFVTRVVHVLQDNVLRS
jgi:hypothetical protein